MVNSKKVSIFFMMTMTIFLTFLDVKDLSYKITMCGPEPLWSFTADFYEAISDIELVSFLKANNGTWVSSAICGTRWRYSAIRSKSSRSRPYLLARVIHEPFPTRTYTSMVYSLTYNLPETVYRANMVTMVAPEDVSALNASTRLVFEQFGTQTDLWEDTLCYEVLPLPDNGHSVQRAIPEEYGCIWSEPDGGKLHTVHVDKAASKYFHILSDWVGWGWIIID